MYLWEPLQKHAVYTCDQISDPGTPRFGLFHRYRTHDTQAQQIRATELFSHSNASSTYT